jgi:hypothetical protein
MATKKTEISVVVSGGIGNQLFQFGFGLLLSDLHFCQVYFDCASFNKNLIHEGFLLEKFIDNARCSGFSVDIKNINLIDRFCSRLGGSNKSFILNMLGCSIIDEIVPYRYELQGVVVGKRNIFRGSWQSEKYFGHVSIKVKDIIRHTLLDVSPTFVFSVLEDLQSQGSVALHIRRGDYAQNAALLETYGLMTERYYCNAIERICETVKNPKFFVFSDDPSWVRANMQFPVDICFVSDGSMSSLQELSLMSRCNHFVTANSSFSWWAAYLGHQEGKIVITPEKWFLSQDSTPDLIPESWIRIGHAARLSS